MLKLARCPHLLIASLATLPSMSLIPFVPFTSRLVTAKRRRSEIAATPLRPIVPETTAWQAASDDSSPAMAGRLCPGYGLGVFALATLLRGRCRGKEPD